MKKNGATTTQQFKGNRWVLFLAACEAMESQLQRLGKKWAAICTWTEQQWLVLQDLLLKWQNFSEEQAKFSDWLAEKEGILGTMMESDLTDPDTVIKQVKDLKVSPPEKNSTVHDQPIPLNMAL